MPRPHPLTRKGVWWALNDFLVVPSSSLDTEQPNEIALCHAAMCSTSRPFCSLVPRPHPPRGLASVALYSSHRNNSILLNGHQTPFLVRGWGLATKLQLNRPASCYVGLTMRINTCVLDWLQSLFHTQLFWLFYHQFFAWKLVKQISTIFLLLCW